MVGISVGQKDGSVVGISIGKKDGNEDGIILGSYEGVGDGTIDGTLQKLFNWFVQFSIEDKVKILRQTL